MSVLILLLCVLFVLFSAYAPVAVVGAVICAGLYLIACHHEQGYTDSRTT